MSFFYILWYQLFTIFLPHRHPFPPEERTEKLGNLLVPFFVLCVLWYCSFRHQRILQKCSAYVGEQFINETQSKIFWNSSHTWTVAAFKKVTRGQQLLTVTFPYDIRKFVRLPLVVVFLIAFVTASGFSLCLFYLQSHPHLEIHLKIQTAVLQAKCMQYMIVCGNVCNKISKVTCLWGKKHKTFNPFDNSVSHWTILFHDKKV